MVLTIIDTFGILFSNFYALPSLKATNGTPTGMITGFMNFIYNLEHDYQTDYLLFSIDSREKNLRKEIYSQYKAHRTTPDELKAQLPIAIDLIQKMGFKTLEIDGYESDDIIASIVKVVKTKKPQIDKIVIVTYDKDMYQLVDDDRVVIYDPRKKEFINEQKVFDKFGVYPKDFVDFQALVGDSSDNVPGVKGIGVKTAAKLINQYHTLENIYQHIDQIKGAIHNKLIQDKQNAFLSRELVKLKDDLFDDINLDEFATISNPILKIADELNALDLQRIVQKAQAAQTQDEIHIPFATITDEKELFEIIDRIDTIVAFDTETTSLHKDKQIVGFSFAFDEEAYYVPINHFYLGVTKQIPQDVALKAIQKLFTKPIIGHNLKFDLDLLYNYSLEKITPFMDTMILAWIIDPASKVGLDHLSKTYLKHDMIKFKDIVKKGENFGNIDIQIATKYACEDAYITLKLYHYLKDKIWQEVKWDIEEIELPFINLLIDIEKRGIKIDKEYFSQLEKTLQQELDKLIDEIYQLANEKFNINSPKQLGYVLFEKLKLPAKKKTKTGYSTNEAVLKSLQEYDIVKKILEYRELFKLQSTYVKPLLSFAKDDTIYTSFLQTGTATGRLSSKDPNLQNIPTNKHINIRYGFVAREGNLLYSLDYSQIELRLLAHFSQDATLIQAFNEDKDIHLETAIKIFGKDNAHKYRSVAKSINFGIIYGMGPKKLAETIDISFKEAKEFINKYFDNFQSVKTFLNQQKEQVRRRGYVSTLFNRRRFFDFSMANEFLASNYEREAINTIFQGSAADLIKYAMLKINSLNHNDLILQIHDELIFDSNNDSHIQTYKQIMEEIYPLRVPLKVSISASRRWGEMK
ncbi:MAG: DNA polymerase I [Epsilonproteobacteria bacterium]|nr:DNA polymerase I [Campylobacterota bacterium]